MAILLMLVLLVAFFTIGKRDIDNADQAIKNLEKSLPPEVILENAHWGCMAEILRIILWILVGISIFVLVVAILVHGFNIDRL